MVINSLHFYLLILSFIIDVSEVIFFVRSVYSLSIFYIMWILIIKSRCVVNLYFEYIAINVFVFLSKYIDQETT